MRMASAHWVIRRESSVVNSVRRGNKSGGDFSLRTRRRRGTQSRIAFGTTKGFWSLLRVIIMRDPPSKSDATSSALRVGMSRYSTKAGRKTYNDEKHANNPDPAR